MEKDKYVDETWKEVAAKEKEQLDQEQQSSSQKGNSKIHLANDLQKGDSPLDKDLEETIAREEKQDMRDQDTSSLNERESTTAPMDKSENEKDSSASEVDFLNYITSLAVQVMIFLGEIPNPLTNKNEKNLQQAKFLIDTLTLLREKTKGNLTQQENDMLNGAIYELQMKYVELAKKE